MTRLILALILTAVAVAAEDRIVAGPYTVNVTPRSATVMWIVESARATLSLEPGKAGTTAPAVRAEKITFTGLQAGKTYYYDLNGSDAGKGSFKTAPSVAAPFQFVVYGDTRTRHDVHRSIIDRIVRVAQPDFAIHTGDQVSDGPDRALWPLFFEIEGALLRKAGFYPSLGNHEKNAPEWYEFFNTAAPYYSFNWGTAHFSVLNTDLTNSATSPEARQRLWDEQVKWLRDDLERNQRADFRFVAGHHPPITAVSTRQGDNLHIAALMPLFQTYKVAATFWGHDHNYQHFLRAGVHYYVTGGGGAPLYDVNKPPADITKKVVSTENFLLVKIDGKTARIEAFRPDGETIEITDLK